MQCNEKDTSGCRTASDVQLQQLTPELPNDGDCNAGKLQCRCGRKLKPPQPGDDSNEGGWNRSRPEHARAADARQHR
jgi:hypothetical protein